MIRGNTMKNFLLASVLAILPAHGQAQSPFGYNAPASQPLPVIPAQLSLNGYLGVQYGLPNYVGSPNGAFNQGSGCVPGYAACFTIPSGRQLREGRGTLTIKADNVEVLVYVVCGAGSEIVVALNAKTLSGTAPLTVFWSTPVLSPNDPNTLGNGAQQCQIRWQADNNNPFPLGDGAAFEVQGVFTPY